jgi:hypothetical protein
MSFDFNQCYRPTSGYPLSGNVGWGLYNRLTAPGGLVGVLTVLVATASLFDLAGHRFFFSNGRNTSCMYGKTSVQY